MSAETHAQRFEHALELVGLGVDIPAAAARAGVTTAALRTHCRKAGLFVAKDAHCAFRLARRAGTARAHAAVLELHAQGWTPQAIASQVGRTPLGVARIIYRHTGKSAFPAPAAKLAGVRRSARRARLEEAAYDYLARLARGERVSQRMTAVDFGVSPVSLAACVSRIRRERKLAAIDAQQAARDTRLQRSSRQ